MELLEFSYSVAKQTGRFVASPGEPGEMSGADLQVLTSFLFPEEAETRLEPGEFVQIKLGQGGKTLFNYKRTSEEESLEYLGDAPLPETYVDLSELIALNWGITSRVQLDNFLVVRPRSLTTRGKEYWEKASSLRQEEEALEAETREYLEPEEQRAFVRLKAELAVAQRRVGVLNGTRRLLWSKVCQLQDQLEKFAAATKGITGSPVKPEHLAEVQEAKVEVEKVKERVDWLEAETEKLEPQVKAYSLRLWFLGIGALLAAGAILGIVFGFVNLGAALMGGTVGLVLAVWALVKVRGFKPDVDRYFELHDELLDRKNQYRKAIKSLKQVLAGEDEEHLWQRARAQEEAQEIRNRLEHSLDSYTKAWQARSSAEAQAEVKALLDRVAALLGQINPELNQRWQEHWRLRQGFINELEAVSFREDFWEKSEAELEPDFWEVYPYYLDLVAEATAPVFTAVPEKKFSLNRQIIVVS
ncbi:MAG: hypothetical protein H0Z38_01970 [Firmicutes bacterium]|nr:hypothetical protein [Bacillota bacterium]